MPISFRSLTYIYDEGMPYAHTALKDIDLDIREGVITAVIGETGSGKSTLVEHLNALLLPSRGSLEILDHTIVAKEKNKNLKALRREAGLVFQFSEYQLFEETILKDVAFGPKNFGVEEKEAEKKAAEALKMVGIDESLFANSPLDLSGGQKRRVAIAGILAIDPKIIVLDEPTAGLDPSGAKEMINLFVSLNKKLKKTIILVSHDMEVVYMYADDTVILTKGKVSYSGSTLDLFNDRVKLKRYDILEPQIVTLKYELMEKGFALRPEDRTLEMVVNRVAKEIHR